jgi:hypothetical protein
VFLVHADHPHVAERREDRGAGADHDARVASRDPLALVAPLGIGQPRVQQRDSVGEARPKPAERLRRQRDLRHEHDRATPAFERRCAGLEVHLGLAAAGLSVEQEVAAARIERPRDASECISLRLRQLRRLGLADESLARTRPLFPPLPLERRDQLERPSRRRAVVVGDPERQVDEHGRHLVDDRLDGDRFDPGGRLVADVDHDAATPRAAERHRDDRTLARAVGELVREGPRECARGHERIDGRVAGHCPERSRALGARRLPRRE